MRMIILPGSRQIKGENSPATIYIVWLEKMSGTCAA